MGSLIVMEQPGKMNPETRMRLQRLFERFSENADDESGVLLADALSTWSLATKPRPPLDNGFWSDLKTMMREDAIAARIEHTTPARRGRGRACLSITSNRGANVS